MQKDRRLYAIGYIDSHTEGEPTRVLWDRDYRWPEGGVPEGLRRAVLDEPRGYEALVAAFWAPPEDGAESLGRVTFANNVGELRMCIHATIGLAHTLHFLGEIKAQREPYRLQTGVGPVAFEVGRDGAVTVENIRCHAAPEILHIPTRWGDIAGQLAYSGNWFFISEASPISIVPEAIDELTALTWEIRRYLDGRGIRGQGEGDPAEGAGIVDHVQLVSRRPGREDADSRNFVLCPGGAYDRSPCGTGTSAYLACLAARGELAAGARWRQQSILGTFFDASYRPSSDGRGIIPRITGRAHLTGRGKLLFSPDDALHGGSGPPQGWK